MERQNDSFIHSFFMNLLFSPSTRCQQYPSSALLNIMALDAIPTTAPAYSPEILKRSVGGGDDGTSLRKDLVFLFLGCEAKPPYGPYLHTASLFLDLICRALIKCSNSSTTATTVVIKVYSVSQGNFPNPQDYEECSGIILPGSFNSAYDEEPWILQLSKVIQEELVAKARPTLGVCFGHQLYAHSFADGGVSKCPAGPQAGRKRSTLTKAGQQFLSSNNDGNNKSTSLQLFYTHGDMVERLPSQGVSLGGNEQVPVQAALYFESPPAEQRRPIAITFQAHPEYGSQNGMEGTLYPTVQAMEERGDITSDQAQQAKDDAKLRLEAVESESVSVMITVGRLLGWFPEPSQ